MNPIDAHAFTTIVEHLDKAITKLDYMVHNHTSYSATDFSYALGNINALIVVRDTIAPSYNLTIADARLTHFLKKLNTLYRSTGWPDKFNRLFEDYNNLPEAIQ